MHPYRISGRVAAIFSYWAIACSAPQMGMVIDTSIVTQAPRHVRLLKAVNEAPVRSIIPTHGHGDHTGGVPLWKQNGTEIIAQKKHVEFMNYQKRLDGFFARRNAAQFALPI